ncbi:hypothetical protein [Roseibium album]|uniref:hypothetical protein n=1 Tax=Roseibium album TaxID=311410 RepID=UPI002492B66C|nr:hypothetical protein [Roseibium album]
MSGFGMKAIREGEMSIARTAMPADYKNWRQGEEEKHLIDGHPPHEARTMKV